MGQLNLFAISLNDKVRQAIINYKGNILWKVALARMLSESTNPYSYAFENSLEYNYIVIDIEPPLTNADVMWLFRGIMFEEYPCEDKQILLTYTIERVLNPDVTGHRNGRHLRRQVKSQDEWKQVNIFRRALEVVAMGFRHLKKDAAANGAHIEVNAQFTPDGEFHIPQPVIIEYAPRSKDRTKAHTATPPKTHTPTAYEAETVQSGTGAVSEALKAHDVNHPSVGEQMPLEKEGTEAVPFPTDTETPSSEGSASDPAVGEF